MVFTNRELDILTAAVLSEIGDIKEMPYTRFPSESVRLMLIMERQSIHSKLVDMYREGTGEVAE